MMLTVALTAPGSVLRLASLIDVHHGYWGRLSDNLRHDVYNDVTAVDVLMLMAAVRHCRGCQRQSRRRENAELHDDRENDVALSTASFGVATAVLRR
jgi:hypothetical protein